MAHFYQPILNSIGDAWLLLIILSSLAVLMNKSGLHDDDLVKKNVSACQVYLIS